MIKLSKRLLMVSNMVRKNSVVADIGTDHAYLPVYLIQKGICKKAIAADLRKMPLKNAETTVRESGLENSVTLILSDGLDNIPENSATDITLTGMGGDLISDILSRPTWLKSNKIRVIAQPQTHSECVRKFFIENGFEIIREDACIDDDRNYICICADYTGNIREYDFGFEYYGLLPQCNNPSAGEYLEHQRNRFYKRATSLKNAGQNDEESNFLYKLVKKFDEILEK